MHRPSRRHILKSALMWPMAAATPSVMAVPLWGRVSPASDITDAERAQMAAVANAFRTTFEVPGLAVAIARQGTLAYDEAFGLADRERSEALTPNHLFRIASVTKPITSCTILDLVEGGRLRLEDHVFGQNAVLGTTYGTRPYGRYIEDITIAHLLTHTAGGWPNNASDPMFHNSTMSHAELISWTLDNVPLTASPGQSFAYSNFGYCLLGRVIEAVTRRAYSNHVQDRILTRSGVSRMTLAGNALADRLSDEVRYYSKSGEDDPYGFNVRRMDSHGGWLATASDVVAFARHVDGMTTTPNILRPDTIKVMTTVTAAAGNPGYAKGWFVRNDLNNWWHIGTLPGTCTILVRTATGFCWAALTNTLRRGTKMDSTLDTMVWDMVRQVAAWHA